MTDIINIYKEPCAAIFSGKLLPPPEPAWKSALMNAMTLDYVFRMGELADIEEDRFWSQARVLIAISAVTALIVLLQWALA